METPTATFESVFRALFVGQPKGAQLQSVLDAHPLMARFIGLARNGTMARKRHFLDSYPVFLSMSVVRCLCQDGVLLKPFAKLFADFGVDIQVGDGQVRVTTYDERYPLGKGPIEQLWGAVDDGGMTPVQALAAASEPALASRLSSIYVSALSRSNLAIMRTREFQRAAGRQHLVMAAVAAIDSARTLANADDIWAVRKWSGAAWVEIATYSFMQLADLRIFAHAIEVADGLIADAKRRNDMQFLGRILLLKAILFLDPFTAERANDAGYAQAIERWAALGREAMGPEAVASQQRCPMPPPGEALAQSIDLFRQALAVGVGFDQLVLHAAYAQALFRARMLHVPVDVDELRRVATIGLQLATNANDLARVKQTSELLHAADQLRAIRRIRLAELELSSMLSLGVDERARMEQWMFQLDAMADTVGPVDLTIGPAKIYSALPPKMSASRRTAHQVLLATACLAFEREEEGLEILGDQRLAHEQHPAGIVDAIRWLGGFLSLNAGAAVFARKQFGPAVERYVDCLHVATSLNLPALSSSCFERVRDLARVPEAQVDVLVALYNYGLVLERSMSTIDLWGLQQLHRLVNAVLHEQADETSAIGFLWQISKGLRFATIANRGIAELTHLNGPNWHAVDRALAEALLEADKAPPEAGANAGLGVVGYAASALDASAARQAQTTLPSARARYDRLLESTLLEAAVISRRLPFEELPLVNDAYVQESIGPATVMANFYLGQSLSGQTTIYLMLMTTDERRIAAISIEGLPDLALVSDGEMSHVLALAVSSLLEAIPKEPAGGAMVEPRTLDHLQRLYGMLFSGLAGVLDRLHSAGKTHLCIVPHGPLHFLPFHLLGAGSEPLAAKWTVTYLPNLALLKLDSRRPRAPFDRPRGVASFACGRWVSDDYEPLPEAVEEAAAIAGVFGVEPLLEDRFDLDHVAAALGSGTRYVHIAGHGQMDVEAPCFHHVLMAPRHGVDQKLHAYQLLRLDLRGLALVTLGSCETALGRFDISDNLRGLPAYLFQCGASAIVGTLWKVDSLAAVTFFTELYSRLKDSDDRLAAFAQAQRVTRVRHPRYCDWGAFCYLGDWTGSKLGPALRSVPGISSLRWTA